MIAISKFYSPERVTLRQPKCSNVVARQSKQTAKWFICHDSGAIFGLLLRMLNHESMTQQRLLEILFI